MQLAVSGILMLRGRHGDAAAVALHALDRFVEVNDEGGLVHSLDWLAISATVLTPDEGLVLAGAAHNLKARRGGFIAIPQLGVGEPRTIASGNLPDDAVDSLWHTGRELDLDDAVALAQRWGEAHDITPAPIDVEWLSSVG